MKASIWVVLFKCLHLVICDITFSKQDLFLTLNKGSQFVDLKVENNEYIGRTIQLVIEKEHVDLIDVKPKTILIEKSPQVTSIEVKPLNAGHADVTANYTEWNDLKGLFFRATINKIPTLDNISLVIGWMYFVIWSASFYPQAYTNFKRKSVVGLNFDFLSLNLVGFILYGSYNVGLYYIPAIRDEYHDRFPRGLNPVQLNDIFFAWHAVLLTLVTIIQCFIYERDEQRVSTTARILLGLYAIFLIVCAILAFNNTFNINWLDFLNYCSYVKLSITLIKYLPQAFLNYKRKSTIGWSIENVLCDFTGGLLSTLQMLLNAYNYDDWASIFGDLTKFGLGAFSIFFDIFFMVQHYILYRHSLYQDNSEL